MSSINKLSGRLEVTGEIGETLDAQLVAARARAERLAGAGAGLKEANDVSVASVHRAVDCDVETGTLTLSRISSDKELQSTVKRYITKVAEAIHNLSIRVKGEEVGAHGRCAGIEASLEIVSRYHKTSKARAEQAVMAASEPQPKTKRSKRKAGQHPGPSKAAIRRPSKKASAKGGEKA